MNENQKREARIKAAMKDGPTPRFERIDSGKELGERSPDGLTVLQKLVLDTCTALVASGRPMSAKKIFENAVECANLWLALLAKEDA